MPIIRRSNCVLLPTVICPVVAIVMLESGNILHTVNTSCYPTLQHHNGYNRQSGNILHTVHTSCHPTLQHHNGYNRTDNYMQWNAVGSPDDGHRDARNMLRYY